MRPKLSPRNALPVSLGILLLTACGGGSGSGRSTPTANTTISFAASVLANRVSGTPGTKFELDATLKGLAPTSVRYEWNLGNGSLSSGPHAEVSYAVPGTYAVTLTATDDQSGAQASGSLLLAVIDPDHPVGLFGEALPALPGDTDGDGTLSLRDSQLVRQHLASLVPISDVGMAARADFDIDGSITDRDASLLSEAVLQGMRVPSHLEPARGQPGCMITLYSPRLLDADTSVVLRVGFSAPIMPTRLVLGRVSFMVPLDVLTPGQFTNNPGTTSIDLLVDGVIADSFSFQVLAADPVPNPPLADIEQLFQAMPPLRSQHAADMQDFLATPTAATLGLTVNDSALLVAMLQESSKQLAAAEADIHGKLTILDPDGQNALARIANANGIGAALDAVRSVAAQRSPTSGLSADASDLEKLCALQRVQDAIQRVDNAARITCDTLLALFAGAVILPFDGVFLDAVALSAAADACASYYTLLEIPRFVDSLLPTPGAQLILTAAPAGPLAPGESATITPSIQLNGIGNICILGKKLGVPSFSLEDYLTEGITQEIIRNTPISLLVAAAKKVSRAVTKQIEQVIESAVRSVIGSLPLVEAIEDAVHSLCTQLTNLSGLGLPVDPNLVFALIRVPAEGRLTPATGPSPILYTCSTTPNPKSNGVVAIYGSLTLCSELVVGRVLVSCGDTRNVTISMGDAGTKLDDIFEVVVDGQSILTSNVPVRAVSKTLSLTTGTHRLDMKGRAAPDGIGTYFIQVDGATLGNGPPLKGTNLVPGVVLSWDLVIN